MSGVTETKSYTAKHTVSVIIPVYNAEKFLGECLDSVIKQEYPKQLLEVSIYDDGSTDKSAAILDAWVSEHLG